MMTEMLGALGQHEMIPIVTFLDRHQDSGELIMIARKCFGRSRLQNAGDFFGYHNSKNFDWLTICDMKRFQFTESR